MRVLYHHLLDPGSRVVRLLLAEKGLAAELQHEEPWKRRDAFLRLNPAAEVPVLVDEDGTVVPGAAIIAEYLDERRPQPGFIGFNAVSRVEVRRLTAWFMQKFAREVADLQIEEKVVKRLAGLGFPDAATIRVANANIHYHLDYIGYLLEDRKWLAGDILSLADLAAAGQLSCVDYLGSVPWEEHPGARDWYARMKSRPSMRAVLADRLPGLRPPDYYDDPDF